MTLILPPTSVIRVSRTGFDLARFAEADRMTRDTGTYLIPAINRRSGLVAYFVGASPTGSMVHRTGERCPCSADGQPQGNSRERSPGRGSSWRGIHADHRLPSRLAYLKAFPTNRKRGRLGPLRLSPTCGGHGSNRGISCRSR